MRYFAQLREQAGCSEEEVEVSEGTTVEQLHDLLFPPPERLPVVLAVNQHYVPGAHLLNEGDEVAFIPPLGGG